MTTNKIAGDAGLAFLYARSDVGLRNDFQRSAGHG